jgi:2-C-methyl-D-erythritol 4-phosphate cytidylyltransferase
MGRFGVILPAAGQSRRFGSDGPGKVERTLAGRAVWSHAASAFAGRADVVVILLAVSADDRERFERDHADDLAAMGVRVVEGGAERHDTVARALAALDRSCDHVAVHDAARPCIDRATIDAVFAAAIEHGAALPGLSVTDTLKRVDEAGWAEATVPRAGLVAVQTPQAFRRDLLERAHAERHRLEAAITDDAQLVEAIGHRVRVVPGSPWNLKITTRDDLNRAELYFRMTRPEGWA